MKRFLCVWVKRLVERSVKTRGVKGELSMETKLWREVLSPYYAAVDELVMKFRNISKRCYDTGVYSPIQDVEGRVKKISSILEKAQKKGVELNDIENQIKDIAGIRIICQFVEDIETVVEIVRKRDDMRVLEERDYVTNSKESGYRSYHMIVEYEVYMIDSPKKIKAEIQIRTMAMNFWGTIEHSLQYKYRGQMPEHIAERLHAAADAIIMLDREMSSVRDEIMDAQKYMNQTDRIITVILNNIQNLYGIANKREIEKIQDEFYRIYEKNDLEMLEHFCDELDVIAEGYRAQSMPEEM